MYTLPKVNQSNESLLSMSKKYEDIRDYSLTAVGFMGLAVSAAFVVMEIPAIVAGGICLIIAGGALQRISNRAEDGTDK